MKGKEPERIEGDPESPVNRGWLCSKGLAALEYLHHPNRLTQPLKRRGGKGSGAWEKITWDKALDLLAPSGKVELYSSRLAEWGFDPLPDYREIPGTPFSDPEIAKDYPLLFTSWKSEQYRHRIRYTTGRLGLYPDKKREDKTKGNDHARYCPRNHRRGLWLVVS